MTAAAFDPARTRERLVRLQAEITLASQLQDWPRAAVAVKAKDDERLQFVVTWLATVRRNHRPAITNAGVRYLSAAEAEARWGISQQTVSRWRRRYLRPQPDQPLREGTAPEDVPSIAASTSRAADTMAVPTSAAEMEQPPPPAAEPEAEPTSPTPALEPEPEPAELKLIELARGAYSWMNRTELLGLLAECQSGRVSNARAVTAAARLLLAEQDSRR